MLRNFMNKNSVFYIQKEAWEDMQEYKDGFKDVIKQREKNRIPFLHQSPQISYRPYLVEYLKKICIEKKLSHCTLHLAVYLLDVFMDNFNIQPDRLQLLVNNCLLLAAKFEENTATIPKISELNAATNNRYTLADFKCLEVIILKFFDWYIMFPTAAHYTHYYIQGMICPQDYNNNNQAYGSIRTMFFNLHDCITEYLDQIIDNIHYMQCFSPSKLAAAVIAASRLQMGLEMWTEQLVDLTDYKEKDFKEPLMVLTKKKHFECCFTKTEMPDLKP